MSNGSSSALGWALLVTVLTCSAAEVQGPYRCKDPKTGVWTIQQTPCKDETPGPPPPPPPPPPACKLGPDELRRAARLENQFLTRFPDEAAHRRVEAADLKLVADRIEVAKARRRELLEQRRPLEKELEFYKNKPVPAWLQNKVDANDAHLAAIDDILKNREQDLAEIRARFQCLRDTYGKMWTGAAPGSSACNRPVCAPP